MLRAAPTIPTIPAGPKSLAALASYQPIALPPFGDSDFDFEQERECSVRDITQIFGVGSSDVRAALQAAFMRGAWAGRAAGSSIPIFDLSQKDHDEILRKVSL